MIVWACGNSLPSRCLSKTHMLPAFLDHGQCNGLQCRLLIANAFLLKEFHLLIRIALFCVSCWCFTSLKARSREGTNHHRPGGLRLLEGNNHYWSHFTTHPLVKSYSSRHIVSSCREQRQIILWSPTTGCDPMVKGEQTDRIARISEVKNSGRYNVMMWRRRTPKVIYFVDPSTSVPLLSIPVTRESFKWTACT